MSFGERLGMALGQAGQAFGQAYPKMLSERESLSNLQKENEASKRMGIDLSGIQDPELRKLAFSQALQGRREEEKFGRESELSKQKAELDRMQQLEDEESAFRREKKLLKKEYGLRKELQEGKGPSAADVKAKQKKEDSTKAAKGSLQILNRMKDLRKKGNLGYGGAIPVVSGGLGILSSETRKDRGEYKRLGKSLIQASSPIKITNRNEFDALAHDLFDPDTSDAEAEGILDAMETIIRQSLDDQFESGKKILDIDILRDIKKKAGGDKDKASKIAKKMGYEL